MNRSSPYSKDSYGRSTDVECYNCHKRGHYARDCPRKRDVPRSYWSYNNNKYNDRRRSNDEIRSDDTRRQDYRIKRDNQRRIGTLDDREEIPRPHKKSRNSTYESNIATSEYEYILISALSGSSPSYSYKGSS